MPARGPIVWVITITILQGTCGMAFGLLVSALCDNEQVMMMMMVMMMMIMMMMLMIMMIMMMMIR